MKTNIDTGKARKDGWIETWLIFEALGGSREIVEESLKDHIEKLSKTENIFVEKFDFKPTHEVKNPPKPLARGWSQIVNVSLFAKDLYTLMHMVMLYGPSSIEIISPKIRQVPLDEMQNVVNTLAGLMHQFAAAGVGGIVITPSGNKYNAPQ